MRKRILIKEAFKILNKPKIPLRFSADWIIIKQVLELEEFKHLKSLPINLTYKDFKILLELLDK